MLDALLQEEGKRWHLCYLCHPAIPPSRLCWMLGSLRSTQIVLVMVTYSVITAWGGCHLRKQGGMPWEGGQQGGILQHLTCEILWKRSICSQFVHDNSNLFKRKGYWNDADSEQDNYFTSSPAQRRCQVKGPQAVKTCAWQPHECYYHLHVLAWNSCWKRAGQSEVNVWVMRGSCLGRHFACVLSTKQGSERGLYL